MKLYISNRCVECATSEQVLEAVKNNSMFTCRDSLEEYLNGLRRRVNEAYGINVRLLTYDDLVKFLHKVGEIHVSWN